MAKKKKTIGYAVKPPYIDLREALSVVRRIHEEAGGDVSEDQLSTILGNSVRSSSFGLKLHALRNFKLVNQSAKGQRIGLSELARSIFVATSPEEKAQAIKESFLNIRQYRVLHELYGGKLLPVGEYLLNAIREHCKVPSQLTNQWKSSFMASGAAAGLLHQREDGKMQLRLEPDGMEERAPEEAPMPGKDDAGSPAEKDRRDPLKGLRDLERFQVPLLEGKVGVVELPKGWTDSDIKKMLQVLRVMFLWSEAEGKT